MISRRDFLKKSGRAALAVGGGLTIDALLSGCATTRSVQEGPVVYPPLKRHKVEPPENGCYIGFHREYWTPFYESFVGKIGKEPKIMTVSVGMATGFDSFPKGAVRYITSKGAIPFVYRDLSVDILLHGFGDLLDNQEFRKNIAQYATELVAYGKPIFVCTMRELNGNWFSWAKNPETAKKVWQLMWQIFEDQGANEHATWVWEVYCPPLGQLKIDPPEMYYPGDEYVDWIGLSAYARTKYVGLTRSFRSLVARTYRDMRTNHPQKPIVQSEFGRTKDKRQPQWVKEAYETMKPWPGMKAAIYWDSVHYGLGDDHTLSEESKGVLRGVLKDDHFIGSTGGR